MKNTIRGPGVGLSIAKSLGGSATAPIENPLLWNSADKSANITLSVSDTAAANASGLASYASVRSVQSRSSGKYYCEFKVNNDSPASLMIGLSDSGATLESFVGSTALGYGYNASNGGKYNSGILTAFGSVWAAEDVAAVAYDAVSGFIWFALDNVWQDSGNPAAGTNPAFVTSSGAVLFPTGSIFGVESGQLLTIQGNDFNQTYSPPAGFTAWGD